MKRFLLNGFLKERNENLEYPVRVLGSVLCSHPGAEEICRAMRDKYTTSRQRINKITCQNMTVTAKGIQLEKGLTGSEGSLKKFVIERIVYCGVDEQHQKIFAFFYRAPDNLYGGLDCHVVECHSKHDAKRIALKLSEIFQQIAEEKQQERGESSLNQLNIVREKTKSVSMMQLHSSIESFVDHGSCPGSPKITQRSSSRERTLNDSELQLHRAKCENSSGYGDSSDDLTNKISSKNAAKRRKQKAPADKTFQSKGNNRRSSSQTGQVKMDYVNAEIASSHIYRNNSSPTYNPNIERETLLSNEIKEWRTSRKDRNDNPVETKYGDHEYINMKKYVSK